MQNYFMQIVCKLAGGALNVQFYSSRVGLNMSFCNL